MSLVNLYLNSVNGVNFQLINQEVEFDCIKNSSSSCFFQKDGYACTTKTNQNRNLLFYLFCLNNKKIPTVWCKHLLNIRRKFFNFCFRVENSFIPNEL